MSSSSIFASAPFDEKSGVTAPSQQVIERDMQTLKSKGDCEGLDRVRAFIRSAQERGDDRLPPERLLAEQLGMSRSRLRGVLKHLADEGSIWREVGNGTFFGQRPLLGPGAKNAADLAELTNPREVMEARLLLEPELAKLAATRARRDNLAELELCMAKMTNSVDRHEWTFWDRRFHHAIGRAADSVLLLALLETIQTYMSRGIWGELVDKLHPPEGSINKSIAEHLAIFTPIQSRNPELAFAAMHDHLTRVQQVYFNI